VHVTSPCYSGGAWESRWFKHQCRLGHPSPVVSTILDWSRGREPTKDRIKPRRDCNHNPCLGNMKGDALAYMHDAWMWKAPRSIQTKPPLKHLRSDAEMFQLCSSQAKQHRQHARWCSTTSRMISRVWIGPHSNNICIFRLPFFLLASSRNSAGGCQGQTWSILNESTQKSRLKTYPKIKFKK